MKFSFISNPSAVYRSLRRSEEVKGLRKALRNREITEDALNEFRRNLLEEFHPGEQLPHELALAAVAVAIEGRSTPFAEEYVRDLAGLKITELAMAVRIAREAQRSRLNLAGSCTRAFKWESGHDTPRDWQSVPSSPAADVADNEIRFIFSEAG